MKNMRFELLFDASMCIPNGDPYMGLPRMRSDSYCIMSSQSIKYKIKKYLSENGYKLLHYDDNGLTVKAKLQFQKGMSEWELLERAKEFIDFRLFGACDLAKPMTLAYSAPITMQIPVTVDPVILKNVAINRSYRVDETEDGSNVGSGYGNEQELLEYGLFKCYGGVNLKSAEKVGLTDSDIDVFFESLLEMFENDSATHRPVGSMNVRKIVRWEWDDMGKRPYTDYDLESSIEVTKKEGVIIPTQFSDYNIFVNPLQGIDAKEYA